MRTAFEIRPYRPDDETHVLALLQAAFGTWPRDVEGQDPSEFFRWKHLTSPFGRSILLVAQADAGVVGFAGWMRWQVEAAGRTFEAVRGVDVAVAREHRGTGVYKALLRQALEYFPTAAFIFSSPNELSRPSSLKAGRLEVGRFPVLVRPCTPARACIKLGAARWPAPARPSSPPRVDTERASDVLDDGQSVPFLLSEADESGGRLRTLKDLEYLRWRYGSLSDYRAIREERGGRLVGLVIFRVRRKGPLWTSKVCELLIRPGDDQLARHLLRQVVNVASVDYVTCYFPPHSTPRRAAVRAGFVRLPRGPIPTARVLRADVVPDPSRRASWALCLGDLDLL